MILLLKRRDLPRKMVRVSESELKLRICHEIVYGYEISGKRIELKL